MPSRACGQCVPGVAPHTSLLHPASLEYSSKEQRSIRPVTTRPEPSFPLLFPANGPISRQRSLHLPGSPSFRGVPPLSRNPAPRGALPSVRPLPPGRPFLQREPPSAGARTPPSDVPPLCVPPSQRDPTSQRDATGLCDPSSQRGSSPPCAPALWSVTASGGFGPPPRRNPVCPLRLEGELQPASLPSALGPECARPAHPPYPELPVLRRLPLPPGRRRNSQLPPGIRVTSLDPADASGAAGVGGSEQLAT